MLSARTAHLSHAEYLQPLTAAPVTIELDAKKSPLALLAQTCSQIGKADPPASSKESTTRSGLKRGEQRPSSAYECSFKPYHKGGGAAYRGGGNEVSRSILSNDVELRVLSSIRGNTANAASYAAHPFSPSCGEQGSSQQSGGVPPNPLGYSPDSEHETESPGSTSSGCGGGGGQSKKDIDASRPTSEGPRLANSAHARASANCITGSDSDKAESGPGRLRPISPYKAAHPLFPVLPSNVVYHGSVVGAHAGYPSPLIPKHPISSPLTGASPPSFMQGMCRDPYCLSCPSVPHMSSNPCIHEPSSFKSSFPLVYAPHPTHPLYSCILPSDLLPHTCNWESARGPCDKRFTASNELLAHLRAHAALAVEADPKAPSSGPAFCHLHLPHMSSPVGSLRAPHSLAFPRYQPYSNKVYLPPGPSAVSLHSLPATGPYYPHYAFYNQRLGPASTMGYQ
ncbi:zinc finger protein 703-like [Phyllopteryx taeniolatus]|uniref:zinc finger protein 703-like n=1 Tax=Phyllopteryx taeniolatus TaxID=161469 RepID=UPI002AD563CC|nr:zinc finger protein 703-like [Phyllopteryx taeniolatus]